MKRITQAICILMISLLFLHCQKELSYIEDSDPQNPPKVIVNPIPIIANLKGNVVDENNLPIAGVAISVGLNTTTTTTDTNGNFHFNNALLDKKVSFVIALKSGYYKGMRVFGATSGTNQVVIKLMRKLLVGTVNAISGGDVSLSNGAKISLPANGIIEAVSGNAYTGTVNVYAAYIDPSDNDIWQKVPGSFAADDKNGNRVILKSYGMLVVELASTIGTKLQIKTGNVATLTMPIPTVAQASAPSTIPMWYVDEQTGLWKEEGSSSRQGNFYIGDVNHFSTWNNDIPESSLNLSMTLNNNSNLPIANAAVRISRPGSWQQYAGGYTDSLGQAISLIPANEVLLLEIMDPCFNVIYAKNIGPFTQNTDIGIINVPPSSSSVITFTGNIVDCNGSPVINGNIYITYDGVRATSSMSNGRFNVSFIVCSTTVATAKVVVVDRNTQLQSAVINVPVTSPITNVGNVFACGNSSVGFFNFTLDGINYNLSTANNDTLSANSTIGFNGNPRVTILFDEGLPGTRWGKFTMDSVSTTGTFNVISFQPDGNTNFPTRPIPPFTATLTKFANVVGEFYEGSFAGRYWDTIPTSTHYTTGSFRVMRTR